MPVAKLSREFYEEFGDKLTDELVNCLNSIEASYRAELRELFDAHFGRFDEKLERRLAATTADLGGRVAQLRTDLDIRIEQLRVEFHANRADMLKWSLGLWVPVAFGVLGLYLRR